jgi:tetratricopeptide (TPR) repeat protein
VVVRPSVIAVLAAVALGPTDAFADDALPATESESLLDRARAAIEAVRYDEAEPLLDQALRAGRNSPAAITAIYQMSAMTATVLGKRDAATRFYRRWLALDPRAALPTDTADKFREPFIAAQAYVTQNGGFRVRVGKRDDNAVEIVIDSDPLSLVASATLDDGERRAFGVDRRLILPVAKGAAMVRVFVFDQYGNHLVERVFATFADVASDYVLVREVPAWRNWQVWAIAAGVAGGAALFFGREADSAQAELDKIAGSTRSFFYSDITDAIDRRDRSAAIANTLFIGAGALGVTTLVMFAIRPAKRWVFAPKIEGAPGLVARVSF